jgi:hypothetical protein
MWTDCHQARHPVAGEWSKRMGNSVGAGTVSGLDLALHQCQRTRLTRHLPQRGSRRTDKAHAYPRHGTVFATHVQYHSVHGAFPGAVSEDGQVMWVNGKAVRCFANGAMPAAWRNWLVACNPSMLSERADRMLANRRIHSGRSLRGDSHDRRQNPRR